MVRENHFPVCRKHNVHTSISNVPDASLQPFGFSRDMFPHDTRLTPKDGLAARRIRFSEFLPPGPKDTQRPNQSSLEYAKRAEETRLIINKGSCLLEVVQRRI